jgi:hypothetical protein
MTRLEDLLEAGKEDLESIPELVDQAESILEAAKTEAARRTISISDSPVSG